LSKDFGTLDAIPQWARQTLMDHQDDPREAVCSWERLYRGQTGDTLWDAAQKSLLIHGELHNNVRMAWGKAFLNWARHPQDALDLMIDLNHRFALDGNGRENIGCCRKNPAQLSGFGGMNPFKKTCLVCGREFQWRKKWQNCRH
jgi:deoxyribodipyrimidine photolyase